MVWIPSCGAERFGTKEIGQKQVTPTPPMSRRQPPIKCLDKERRDCNGILRDLCSQKEQALTSRSEGMLVCGQQITLGFGREGKGGPEHQDSFRFVIFFTKKNSDLFKVSKTGSPPYTENNSATTASTRTPAG